jgi:hypothetical protein
MTYNGTSTMTLYLDGTSCGTTTASPVPQPVEDDWQDIALSVGGNNGVGDLLDEVILYGVALSPATVQSHSRSLTGLLTAPTITVQPQNVDLCPGGGMNLTVDVTGCSPFTYQWRKNGLNIPGAVDEPGNNGWDTYSVLDPGTYDVIVFDALNNSVQSSPAVVTECSGNPQIVEVPVSRLAYVGDQVIFHVSATGGDLQYQWFYGNNNPINGATNADLVFDKVQASQAGTYTVFVMNGCVPVPSVSASATLTFVSGNVVTWGSSCPTTPSRPRSPDGPSALASPNPCRRVAEHGRGTAAANRRSHHRKDRHRQR